MTTPDERTRALCQAGELLRELQQRRDIPDDISARLEGGDAALPQAMAAALDGRGFAVPGRLELWTGIRAGRTGPAVGYQAKPMSVFSPAQSQEPSLQSQISRSNDV